MHVFIFQWQRSEDPHGNPWLAIVIDPLRGIVKGRPEMKAFRVFPPDYNPPMNETPDGTFVVDDRVRIEKWGACWNRYYELEISFFMSSLSQRTLGTLKNSFLWQSSFTSTPMLEPGSNSLLTVPVLILRSCTKYCQRFLLVFYVFIAVSAHSASHKWAAQSIISPLNTRGLHNRA